jgi:hypothetical protein
VTAETADPKAGRTAPWRGRPRVAEPRTQSLRLRLTPAEAAAVSARAAQAGLSVGAFLRALALGAPGPRAVRRPAVEKAELARALGLLGRYGGNLNQLAHVANATGAMPTAAELDQLKVEVRKMKAVLMQALGRGAAHGD